MTTERAPADSGTDIAIVGMAGQFPGSRDTDELWRNLRDGKECVTWFSREELLAAGEDPELIADPSYVPAAAVLDDIELFDAGFFGYPEHEAALMDPQQRLFLENAWHALEDAGIDPDRAPGLVGVFAGSQMSTYMIYNLIQHKELVAGAGKLAIGLCNDKDSLTSRVSHTLGLTGPSVGVQAYCATSLVAVSVACTSLLTGECDVALAGGVAIEVPHRVGYRYEPGGTSSPDGRCRAFDEAGEGTPHGTGNGLGVVVLRRLADAVADGDRVYGVIRGWAVNHDGAAKAAWVAPGVRGQAGVVAEALAAAGLEPTDLDYLEAHGTGTALGDSIEVAALRQVFGDSPLAIGSVKPNLGHLDRAAGVAGLMKVALALSHEEIPPTINHTRPNAQLARTSMAVVTERRPWPRGERPRRAGVSAFGLGGANAHVVVEEAPVLSRAAGLPRRARQVLVWSARTAEAADSFGARLAELVASGVDIADLAFTLQTGRRVFAHRRAVVASSAAGFESGVLERTDPRQGMGVRFEYTGPAPADDELYRTEPVYRDSFDECSDHGRAMARLLMHWGVVEESSSDVVVTLPGTDGIADVLARLWLAGARIDWRAYHEGRSPRKVSAPKYSFQRSRHWIDPPTDAAGGRAI
ncbi:beta-ketoacyl synthase N-terminal-like domain-containing protein [Actinophytocola algeriensis]|uniref:Acyl transferase domain-containing protein n=1 Tax=Actinophytocola algeriensis TaxID=1768010 RepID=A0A7W7Q9G7_9PSEU|nr:polyketide synthase [Actinophytocola algeriensis]MBB4909442.1 acyl transferase domain-containing protein [Actinophytocola algeriensis]MBE1475432.1 acyl transferase domain-containing protein [Actinophytocola algeriensis]